MTCQTERRKEILEVHVRGKKLAQDVNLELVATRTPGFSGPSCNHSSMKRQYWLRGRKGKRLANSILFVVLKK